MDPIKNCNGRVVNGRLAGILGLVALVWGILLLVPTVRADDEGDPGSAQPRAPSASSFVDGEVHLFQGSQPVGDRAIANTPLFEGARIDTGTDGRAEIQFEDGSVVRLSPETSLTLSVLQGLSASRSVTPSSSSTAALPTSSSRAIANPTICGFSLARPRLPPAASPCSASTPTKLPEKSPCSRGMRTSKVAQPSTCMAAKASPSMHPIRPTPLLPTIEPDSWDAWNSDRDQELSAAAADQTPATRICPTAKTPHGATSMPMETGTTCRIRVTSGPPTKRPVPIGIHTITGTG